MQTSITTWFKKSPAVERSTVASSTTAQDSLGTQSGIAPCLNNQHVSTSSSSPPQLPTPQPTLTSRPATTTTTTTTLAFSHPEKRLVENITLVPCDETNISSFQRLNTLLLPIPYPQTFYREILSDPIAADLTILAVWHDDPKTASSQQGTVIGGVQGRVIGGIRCRILADPSTQAAQRDKILYVSTLGVLSPFRSYGVATHLLHAVVERGIRKYGVNAVGAHVWEASRDAREWYRKRGFRETHMEERYYRRLAPQGAYVLRREIGPRDLLDFGRA